MTQPGSHPTLDLSRISFPTDNVTIGDLRVHQRDLFTDEKSDTYPNVSNVIAFATISVERVLAKRAFAAAAGLPDPFPLDGSMCAYTRQEAVLMLNADYKRYGISTGLQSTRQLVREFEKAAANQAKSVFYN